MIALLGNNKPKELRYMSDQILEKVQRAHTLNIQIKHLWLMVRRDQVMKYLTNTKA